MTVLDRYGIKEVADVVFYAINEDGTPGAPVLYLDTLKVSTIEQTAENTSARGGKGNVELIAWDYNKEINLTLEDALFSAKSLALMYGVDPTNEKEFATASKVRKTVPFSQVVESNIISTNAGAIDLTGTNVTEIGFYNASGAALEVSGENNGAKIAAAKNMKESDGSYKCAYVTFTLTIEGTEIVISAASYPGTYYVTGDTYARSAATGNDELFQFVIPKAKMQSSVTLTMQAEGDPSTFSMTLKVLRPANGQMMKLIKYNLVSEG